MADPVTLAAGGAVIGAALKPKNPLQGALLGATAGFTGGTALGIGAAGAATGGTGLAAGLGEGAGLTTAGSGTGLTGLTAANTATGYGLGSAGTSSALGLSAVPVDTLAAAPAAYTMAPASYALADTAATPSAYAPSFMEKIGMAGKSVFENPMMTGQALSATQGLLTPEQQAPSAPTIPVQSRKQLAAFDPMAAMNPYKQSVVGGQPISLI